jgi:hypothetical protein
MKNPHIIPQTWPFSCTACHHVWESVYEAWHADDGHGGQVVTWRHKGTASMPPWIEPSCPACSSLSVKTLPPRARRPADDEDHAEIPGRGHGGARPDR